MRATKTDTTRRVPVEDKNKQHGFTIIEVALVLAIAGLIFLVVFLALPALQNSQKDTARKQDVGRVVSALQSYMADHGGNLSVVLTSVTVNGSGGQGYQTFPANGTSSSGFSGYLGKLDQDTAAIVYNYTWTNNEINWLKSSGGYGYAYVSLGEGCLSGTSGANSSSSSNAAVYQKLSNGTIYCASM